MAPSLNYIDLFSGIGGFAVALKDIATPMLYCDNSPAVRAALVDIMGGGRLPTAPIVDDVRNIKEIKGIVANRPLDILTAGVPCCGFSRRGNREGLRDERSGLFRATCEVVRTVKPRIVLYENVADIRSANSGADFAEIIGTMTGMGYKVRWTVVAASDVGAPHERSRWFCMCVRRGPRLPDLAVSCGRKTWSNMPALTCEFKKISAPLFMLGNSIVPFTARTAFFRLYTGFHGGKSYRADCLADTTMPAVKGTVPRHACVIDGQIVACKVETKRDAPPLAIVLDPRHFTTRKRYVENGSRPKRSPLVTTPITLVRWPTPRTGGITHSHNLSARTRMDLATVAMYASSINGVRQRATDDSMRMNVRFCEWLMGFPINYLGSFD